MPDIFPASKPFGDLEVPRSEAGRKAELNSQARRRREREQRHRHKHEQDEEGLEVDTFEHRPHPPMPTERKPLRIGKPGLAQ